jgi:hypothetical protein
LRRIKIAAAGNGLCATINYLSGAGTIGLGTTIKYLMQQVGQGPLQKAGNELC